jgi:hypothetical protein
MEPQSSLPYSQAPATCPYPEPTPSSPHNPFSLPEDPRRRISEVQATAFRTTSLTRAATTTHSHTQTNIKTLNFIDVRLWHQTLYCCLLICGTPCILLGRFQSFAAKYWFHFQDTRMVVGTYLKYYTTQARRPKCEFLPP